MQTLDVGCGAGRYVSKPCGNINLDINKPNRKITDFVQADAHHLPFQDNTFEIVYCFEVIEHVESPLKMIREFHRVVKKDGTLVLSTPNAWYIRQLFQTFIRGEYKTTPDHIASFTNVTLKQLLEKVFAHVDVTFITLKRGDEKIFPHHTLYHIVSLITPFVFLKNRHLLAKAFKRK